MNDIQIEFENSLCKEPTFDDQWDYWDPMKEEFDNTNLNSYDHGPGAQLDFDLQRPAYRDKNNQIVFKVMVNSIPQGLTQVGLENIFLHFGKPTISKCFKEAPNQLKWALIEFKTLKEAQAAVIQLEGFHGMKVNFARSDEENDRIKKKKLEEELLYKQMLTTPLSNMQPNVTANQSPAVLNRNLLRVFARGQNRGKMVMNAFRAHHQKGPGLRNCAWSDGIPDFRDPGGLMYDSKAYRHEGSNRVLQNLVISTNSCSARKVAMGRGFVPPDPQAVPCGTSIQGSIGHDVCVPVQVCVKCGSETVQKCSQCGTPYCSKVCQRQDFGRHKFKCVPRESINAVVDSTMPNSQKVAPLTQNVDDAQVFLSLNNRPRFWGKPEKNILSLLDRGSNAILSICTEENQKYCGGLCCGEGFDITDKLCLKLPSILKEKSEDVNFWPYVGLLVAVRFDNSIWRGYILNTPIVGSSTIFTVALCDLGIVKNIEARDVLKLPSEFQSLPELAVTCELIQSRSDLAFLMGPSKQFSLILESSNDLKVTAKVMAEDRSTELGVVSLSPWVPSSTNHLIAVQMHSPCRVVLSAYHHQHALYVRPNSQEYQEQLFNLMQNVAMVHVTSPQLGRTPYQGEMLACQYPKDNNYYRAVVQDGSTSIPGNYDVFFVDFGNIESVSVNGMKALPEELKACACMAVKVSLKDVRKGPLTEAAVQFLNTVLQKEQELKLEYSLYSNEGVQLFFMDNTCLNSKLNELLMPQWEHSMNSGLQPDGGEVFMLENFKVLPLLKGGMKRGRTIVTVTNVLVDGRVAVLPDYPEVEHVLNTLAFQMTEYCEATEENTSYNPRYNEVCLAKYTKDGMWYRAVNSETLVATQSCKLLFLDYGNLENVPFKDIRRMVQDFVRAPTIMTLCHIDGLPEELSLDMAKRVKELMTINRCYEVDVLGSIGHGEYTISVPEISNQLKSEFPSE